MPAKRKQPGSAVGTAAASNGATGGTSATPALAVEQPVTIAGGMVYKDMFMTVPLDHWNKACDKTIRIHAREVRAARPWRPCVV